MTVYRAAVLGTLVVALLGGIVALAAAAWTADRCETFAGPHGRESHAVCGPILRAFVAQHGPDGGLGPPTSEEHDPVPIPEQSPGHRQQDFDDGTIDLTVATGRTLVFRGVGSHRATRPIHTEEGPTLNPVKRSHWNAVDELVGLTADAASTRADALGLWFRDITAGNYTEDLRSNRVNVKCDDAGVVTSAVIF